MTSSLNIIQCILLTLMILISGSLAQQECDIITKRSEPPNMFFEMDCESRNLSTLWDAYPKTLGNDLADKFVKIVYDGNPIFTLKPMVTTDASISFSCRHCQLNRILPQSFAGVKHIVRLDLSYNALNVLSFASDSFAEANIMELSLSHNQLDSLPPDLFTHLQLSRFDLSFNRFKTIEQLTPALAIASLIVLDLSNNELTQSHSRYEFNTPKLRELFLQNNQLEEVPLAVSKLGSSLEVLNIGGNQITSLKSSSFSKMASLRHLSVDMSPLLQNVDESALLPLVNLVDLSMKGNPKLKSLNLTDLTVASSLELLDISNCSIRTLYLNRTNNAKVAFPRLRSIKLHDNPWTCDCDLYKAMIGIFHTTTERFESEYNARCHSPYELSTDFLADLLVDPDVCDIKHMQKPNRVMPRDLPYYLRPKLIILSVISVLAVVLLGLAIGLLIVCVKGRLRNASSSVDSPIRYTTVRNSQMPPLPEEPLHTI